MAERLALPTSDHGVAGSNPAGCELLPELKRRFIAQSLSCSPFHRLEMTEILLKGRKTLTHPSIQIYHSAVEDSIHLAVDTGIKDIVVTGDFNYNMLNDITKRKYPVFVSSSRLYNALMNLHTSQRHHLH